MLILIWLEKSAVLVKKIAQTFKNEKKIINKKEKHVTKNGMTGTKKTQNCHNTQFSKETA